MDESAQLPEGDSGLEDSLCGDADIEFVVVFGSRADAPFVDLSDIETLPLEVAHEAVTGEFLCGDENAFRRFKEEIEAAFEEQRDAIRRHHRAVIDRIAENGLHS